MRITVLYRISDGGNPKTKLANATKENCLKNCIETFGLQNVIVFADNCGIETISMVRKLGIDPFEIKLGNAMSWRYVVEYALNRFSNDQYIYLLEDDYLHLASSSEALLEGLNIADYVTLYDHPDKYMINGSNPYVRKGGETCRVLRTNSTHWRTTNSTTMTFATSIKILAEDKSIWWEYTSEGFPNDFGAFQRLQNLGDWNNRIFGKKRTLISSIPGLSTHCETAWLSPFERWDLI